MRYVVLPHGLVFVQASFQDGQIISGQTMDGWNFKVHDSVERLDTGQIVIQRMAHLQDVLRVPNHIVGGKKDLLRWARRNHARLFS